MFKTVLQPRRITLPSKEIKVIKNQDLPSYLWMRVAIFFGDDTLTKIN